MYEEPLSESSKDSLGAEKREAEGEKRVEDACRARGTRKQEVIGEAQAAVDGLSVSSGKPNKSETLRP